ncbi:MAG TPA: hypothetical protein VNV38_07000 [Stellaceae bacterium]|jgi:hypothetical protein|nr:hypothetical protein [Stellaceae bacterium]
MKSSLSVRQAIGAVALALMVLSGFAAPAVAANPDQAPPVAPGQSRVWFVRQLLPGSIMTPPTVYVNGAPIARSAQGTVFYRDFAPGRYAFTVENCLSQTNTGQTMTLQPNTQYAINVTQDDNGAWSCFPEQVSYLRQLQPQQVPYYFTPVTYMGAM